MHSSLKVKIQSTHTLLYSFISLHKCRTMHVHVRHEQKQRSLRMHMYARVYAHALTAHSSRQLLLKPVLYLRWQQWSRSPGLIYLRGGIMNSLWHLIFPSLLIWLSAGMCTVIHTALASGVAPHTFRCSVDSRFTASHPDDANCAWALQSPWGLPKLLKNNVHVVHYRLSQQSAQLPFLFLLFFLHHSLPPPHHFFFAFTPSYCCVIGAWQYPQTISVSQWLRAACIHPEFDRDWEVTWHPGLGWH